MKKEEREKKKKKTEMIALGEACPYTYALLPAWLQLPTIASKKVGKTVSRKVPPALNCYRSQPVNTYPHEQLYFSE